MNSNTRGRLQRTKERTGSWEKYRDVVQAIREDDGKDKGKIMP